MDFFFKWHGWWIELPSAAGSVTVGWFIFRWLAVPYPWFACVMTILIIWLVSLRRASANETEDAEQPSR